MGSKSPDPRSADPWTCSGLLVLSKYTKPYVSAAYLICPSLRTYASPSPRMPHQSITQILLLFLHHSVCPDSPSPSMPFCPSLSSSWLSISQHALPAHHSACPASPPPSMPLPSVFSMQCMHHHPSSLSMTHLLNLRPAKPHIFSDPC